MSLRLADFDASEAVTAADWSVLAEPQVESVVQAVARAFARDYGLTLEYEDAYQEAVIIVAERALRATESRRRGGRPSAPLAVPAPTGPLADGGEAPHCARLLRGRPAQGGEGWPVTAYDRRLVEHLLPAVWDQEAAYGIRNPTAPDADMPKGTVDPKAAGILFAHLADIRRGWATAPLTSVERQALVLRYGADLPDDEAGALQGVTGRATRYRCERGVGKIAAHLNGHSYVDGYEELDDAAA